MKLFLDAKRQPDVDWVWSRTAHGAITMLKGGCVEKISFAPDQPNLVEPVLDWMIENDSPADRAIHKVTAKPKFFRKLFRSAAQPVPQDMAS